MCKTCDLFIHGTLEDLKQHLKRHVGSDPLIVALIAAARHGRVDFIPYLLESGAPINEQSPYGVYTALLNAAKNGKWAFVNTLLEYDPDVTICNEKNKSVIDYAIKARRDDVWKKLVDRGALPGKPKRLAHIKGFVAQRERCRKAAITIVSLARIGKKSNICGKDVMGLVARHVWSMRMKTF